MCDHNYPTYTNVVEQQVKIGKKWVTKKIIETCCSNCGAVLSRNG